MQQWPAWYKGRQVGGQFACTKDGGGRVAAAAALLLACPCHCDATADPPMQHCHAVAAALQYVQWLLDSCCWTVLLQHCSFVALHCHCGCSTAGLLLLRCCCGRLC